MYRTSETNRGFTLIELLVVITIIFVLAATIGWTNSSASGEKLSVATHQLISDIRYTQSLAMGQKSVKSIVWASSGTTYTFLVNPNGSETRRLVTSVAFNTPTLSSLSFNSMGEPIGTCASGCTIQLRYFSETKNIAIAPYTGYAEAS